MDISPEKMYKWQYEHEKMLIIISLRVNANQAP